MTAALLSLYERAALGRPSDFAFLDVDAAGESYSWSDLLDAAAVEARILAEVGVAPGSIVAVECGRSVRCLVAFLAVWRRGGVVVPIDPQWGGWLADQILTHCGAQVYVGDDGKAASIDGSGESAPAGAAIISYTSGTTADPKGVVLGHRQLFDAYSLGAMELSRTTGSLPRRIACAMRVSGMGVIGIHHFWAALMGATLVMVPELTLGTVGSYWEVMVEQGAELTYLVPPLVALLERTAPGPPQGAMPVCLTGGAPLSADLHRRFQERFGTPLLNYYGLTEVGFTAFFGAVGSDGLATQEIGRPGTVTARLRAADGSIALDAAASGGLELSGPALAIGYLKNQVAWEEAVQDGWLSTGDIATRSVDGAYSITGRAKDAVMRGGFVIYLHEVEAAALEVPTVLEAGAIAIEGAEHLEDFGLVVYPRDPARSLDPVGLRKDLIEMVGAARAPRRIVVAEEPLPRISQGKLDRAALRIEWDRLTGKKVAHG